MSTQSTARVLLLANEFDSAHGLREVASRAGLTLELEQAASREEFYVKVQKSAPGLILVNLTGVASLPLTEVLEHARNTTPALHVIVLGSQPPEDAAPRSALQQGALEYVHVSELERLPIIMDRVVRDRDLHTENRRLQYESERAAEVLRDNQKMVTIGRLAASIAHEINNPLESITNLLYLLHSEPDMPASASEYLTLAQRELERVVQISKQTLTFYRETPALVRVRPAELLEEVLVLYGRKIEEKRMKVTREYESDEAVSVFPGEIRQVLSNLITNAIEASDVGGKLRLRVRRAPKWSDRGVRGLRISIGDSGSGIPDSVRERLGEPFFTTKGQNGTGLGLWVTQSIVERYGGHMQVRSSTRRGRRGTVFSVFLPTNMRPQAVPISGGSGPAGWGSRGREVDGSGHAGRDSNTARLRMRGSG